MKLFTTLAVAALAQYAPDPATTEETTTIVPNTGLSCWHCDAKNMTECESIGEQKECADNAQVCMVEVRKRNGVLESVCMGCKWPKACVDNKKQNFKGKWKEQQCKPWAWYKKGASVCRQCCNADDDCAKDFMSNGVGPLDIAGWKENILVQN
ncbi:Oidioi.mRNA.OKI2018_I69.chr2.g7217.t1.cds [Oikopleura dioica]|uniref:Oidioi.mRNA.OKI2018_I69.chr2.g7217.t1.cds n=1 Tax=Oikopleura dioica TaxID=34765 RepID=A0ABN7T900_OIKDI|nr:Oidioi.mRNA.OKI2018_I69.chr2.g7217.t1.cds [Oikopleura dioica]